MIISHATGSLKKWKRTTWRFRRTFQTPLGDLEAFVAVIGAAHLEMVGASLVVESVLFEPRHPPPFAAEETWRRLTHDMTVAVNSPASARALLVAALSDWLDFYFVPEPKPFVIYADHDEYCTFYANSRSKLNRVCDALSQAGFHEVDGYERKA